MNQMDFFFEERAWELTLNSLKGVDSLSAVRFLSLTEDMTEEDLENAYLDLEQRHIMLDISDLPKPAGTGEAAVRLRLEQQLVKEGRLPHGLEQNDPLRLYLEELAATPACGDVQLLALRCAEGSDPARNMLANISLSRVIELAKQQVGRGVLLLDLIQEGSLGLWQSILTYDGSGDFETQRDWWICAYMAKAITFQARQNGVGQKMRQALEDYRAVDERLLGELGRNPTLEEIALELHMSPEDAAAVKKVLDNARTLDMARSAGKPKEEDPDDDKHVEDTAYFQARQRILDLLSGLSEQDAAILSMRFGLEGGLPLSPEDTGRKLGLTAEEVVSRETAALAKLRQSGE